MTTNPTPSAVGLIDVRTPAEYAEVHAAGARLIPLDVLDPKAVMADLNGSAGEPVYVLCKSGTRSAKAGERFRAAGFDNVFRVECGTQAWERAGLVFAGVTDWCGMGLLLARMPWNRRGCEGGTCSR